MPPTIFANPATYVVTCLVLVVAQVVYVTFGFGAGLVAVSCLALVFPDLKDPVVMLSLVNLPAEIVVSWQARREIRWRPILGLGVGIVVGIPVGAWLLDRVAATLTLHVLGGFLVLVGLVFLRLPAGGRWSLPAAAAPPFGLLSGLLTGLFGTGGPPLIVWYHLSAVGKHAFRANLMTIFLLMTFLRVPSYLATGLVTPARAWSSLMVMPAVLVGAWWGHRVHVRLSEETFRRLVASLLAVIGVVLLIR